MVKPHVFFRSSVAVALLAFIIGGPASAQSGDDAEETTILGPEYCFPTKAITEQITKLDTLKASKRDTVALVLHVGIDVNDGEALPERLELRRDGVVIPLPLDENARTRDLVPDLRTEAPDAMFCIVDPAREGRKVQSAGYDMDFSMRVGFIETPGTHDLKTLEDGLKDGRSHYKKMVGTFGFLVPKFTHVAISTDADVFPPVYVTRNGEIVGEPVYEISRDARLYDIDQIEDMDGDGLRIDGPYRISPSPDAKTVARFLGGDKPEIE